MLALLGMLLLGVGGAGEFVADRVLEGAENGPRITTTVRGDGTVGLNVIDARNVLRIGLGVGADDRANLIFYGPNREMVLRLPQ
jgi:hypothetical protein